MAKTPYNTTFISIPDLHAQPIQRSIPIDKVGSVGITRYVRLREAPAPLLVHANCFVSVGPEERGAHLSRLVRSIDESIAIAEKTELNISEFASHIAHRIRSANPQAASVNVEISADIVMHLGIRKLHHLSRTSPYLLLAQAINAISTHAEYIGFEAKVALACPQAQAALLAQLRAQLESQGFSSEALGVLDKIPIPSHTQLSVVRFLLGGYNLSHQLRNVDVPLLIGILEDSASSRTYEYLKRPEEGSVVGSLHRRAFFVEDMIRAFALSAVEFLDAFPDETELKIEATNYESTYSYPLVASTRAYLGNIRTLHSR